MGFSIIGPRHPQCSMANLRYDVEKMGATISLEDKPHYDVKSSHYSVSRITLERENPCYSMKKSHCNVKKSSYSVKKSRYNMVCSSATLFTSRYHSFLVRTPICTNLVLLEILESLEYGYIQIEYFIVDGKYLIHKVCQLIRF